MSVATKLLCNLNEVLLNYLAIGMVVWCVYRIFMLCRKIMKERIDGRNKTNKL